MDRKILVGSVIVLIAIISVGSASAGWFDFLTGGSEHAPDELITCVAAHGEEPEFGFDPMHGWGYHDSGTDPLIQSTILKRNADNEFVNDLATDYEISDDLKTYTVTIRDDVKFTDGSKLTAKDVAFSYNTAKEFGEGADLTHMEEAKADGDKVVFTLDQPDSTFINKLTDVGIVPEATYDNATYGQNPIGSGPYKLAQWDKGQQFILEKNPDGDVDIAEVAVSYADEKIDGYHMEYFDSIDVRGVSLPTTMDEGKTSEDGVAIGNNVTGDPAVRQALAIGIDREELIDGALNGYGNVSYTGVADQLPWAFDAGYKDGQVDQAKAILEEAGWKDTDGDGIREKDGQKAEFTVYYKASAVERQAIAVTLAEQAKELGIEITPKGASWDEIDPDKYSQGVVWGFGSADPYSIEHQYGSDVACVGYDNPGNLKDSAVDALIDTAMAQPTDASYSTWKQAAKQATSHNSFLWIGTMDYTYFVSDDLDISNSTHLIYPHGGDIWGNIYDWKRLETNETA